MIGPGLHSSNPVEAGPNDDHPDDAMKGDNATNLGQLKRLNENEKAEEEISSRMVNGLTEVSELLNNLGVCTRNDGPREPPRTITRGGWRQTGLYHR